MNKELKKVYSRLEAEMIRGCLNEEGIDANVSGSREYASIITGADQGTYVIKVSEQDWPRAHEILNSVTNSFSTPSESFSKPEAQPPQSPNRYLKRAIIYIFIGYCFFPFTLFFSPKPMMTYMRTESSPIKYFWLVIYFSFIIFTIFLVAK